MDLIKTVYPSLIRVVGLSVTDDGFIRQEISENDFVPATLKGKTLVIPTREQRTGPDTDTKALFHPLYENALEGETPLLAQYRHMLIAATNAKIGAMGRDLLVLAGDTSRHPHLRPDQQEFLRYVPECDEERLKRWDAIWKAVRKPGQLHDSFVTMHVTKAKAIKGQNYGYVATVAFPFYEALIEAMELVAEKKANKAKASAKDKVVFGVELRAADLEIFKGLMEYMIPDVDKPEEHMYGSNSNIAPRMDSLMHAFMKLAAHINGIVDTFTNDEGQPQVFDGWDDIKFDSDWVEGMNDLEALWPQIKNIPRAGALAEPEAPATPAPGSTVSPTTVAPGATTAAAMLAGAQQRLAGAPQWPGQPGYAGAAPTPYQQVTQPQYAPPVPTHGGPSTFADMMRANPGLSSSVSANMQQNQNVRSIGGQNYTGPGGYPQGGRRRY